MVADAELCSTMAHPDSQAPRFDVSKFDTVIVALTLKGALRSTEAGSQSAPVWPVSFVSDADVLEETTALPKAGQDVRSSAPGTGGATAFCPFEEEGRGVIGLLGVGEGVLDVEVEAVLVSETVELAE